MNGTRRLWQAVLYQAVDDALHGAASETKMDKRRETDHARSFLTTPSRDLGIVCAGAGLEMEAVIDRMRKLIAEAPTVEELMARKKVRKGAVTPT